MLLSFTPKKKAYLKGRYGEWIAALYLWCLGYEILENRFKTPFGEIDLLVRKKRILVAVEVKSRSSFQRAAFSVTPFQQRRIEKALAYYLARKPQNVFIRFDAILISPFKWPYHIRGAWRSRLF